VDLECCDLVAIEAEDELQINGAAGEIPGEPIGHDERAFLPNDRDRLNRVLVLLLRFDLPLLDGGEPFDRLAFVLDYGILGKAMRQRPGSSAFSAAMYAAIGAGN
jgi:hypothetical protein